MTATVLALWLTATAVLAQNTQDAGADLSRWETTQARIEATLETGTSPVAQLEDLRQELADWRARLLKAQSLNRDEIDSLKAEIEALGPPPDATVDDPEPDQIALRRQALNLELAEAEAPGLAAAAAYNRADTMIAQIDDRIRSRQTEAILEAGPSPMIPSNWAATAEALKMLAEKVNGETHARLSQDWRVRQAVRGLPLTTGMAAIGLLFLVRGRVWMSQLAGWVQSRRDRRGALTLGFLVSLGQIVLPVIGIGMLFGAALSTQLLGPSGRELLLTLGPIVLGTFSALWLAGRLFPASEELPSVFSLDAGHRARARRRALMAGLLVGCAAAVRVLGEQPEVGRAALGVLGLPIYFGLSVSFVSLSRLVSGASRQAPGEVATLGLRILRTATQGLMLVGLVGPLIAIAGFHNLADAVMMPAAMTLGLFGLILALQTPIRDGYAWVTRTDLETAADALVPVLINFLLAVAALPVLALIWGMRPVELLEFYAHFNEGLRLGDVRLTPGDLLAVILVFAAGMIIVRLLQGVLRTTVLPRTRIDHGARTAITSFTGYVGIAIVVLIAINAGGIDLTALAVVVGALSVGVGLGLQNVVQNFVAGIILLIERPISEGDWIEVAGNMGIVSSISVRSTTIETFDKQQMIVPNADFISGTVTNWTRGSQIGRVIVPVGVAYGTDTRRVERILMEIVKENPDIASDPAPGVDFMAFGADSLEFRIRGILADVTTIIATQTELRHRIAERFTEEGIEIPFAQRDIWLRNPEALMPAMKKRGGVSDDRADSKSEEKG